MRKIVFGLAFALSLATLSGGAQAEKYLIDHEIWGWYQKYLRNIANGTRPGAFAITTDGHGAFYSWCQDTRCVAGPTYSQDALNYCEREYNTECVVFAVRDDIRVEYEIRGGAAGSSSSSSNAPALAPAEVTKVKVSPSVKSDIDAYLNNAGSITGRVWALAIAKDGSRVESASCDAVGGGGYYGGGGGCDHTKGDIQGLANKKALKECGGPDECILLYAGKTKMANVEIAAGSSALDTGVSKSTATAAPQPAPAPVVVPAPAIVASAPQPAPVAAPAPPPKPAAKIGATPEVRTDIEAYLGKTQTPGRVWVFAIAKDGSRGAMASCPAGGSYSGGGACNPVVAPVQELASREAIKRCGGPADCLVLYIGDKKAANIEVVAR